MPIVLTYLYHGPSYFAPARDETMFRNYALYNRNRYDNTLTSHIQLKVFYPYSDEESRKLVVPPGDVMIQVFSPVRLKLHASDRSYIEINWKAAEKKGPKVLRELVQHELDRVIKKQMGDVKHD